MRQFPDITAQEFSQWQKLVLEKTGIWISEQRKSFLKNGLISRVSELENMDFEKYFQHLQDSKWAEFEWAFLIDKLTVHETRFFRHEPTFRLIESHTRKWLQDNNNNALEVWSVGCSTGEEVYSIALVLESLKIDEQRFFYGITGTDISFPALAYAREGCYKERAVHNIPLNLVKAHFDNEKRDEYRVKSHIRERTCFIQGNINEVQGFARHGYRIIVCQNLLIYFRSEDKHRILNQLVDCLESGGVLILGPGETTQWQHKQLKRLENKYCLAFIKN
jgi:type IV pilus assembly protein PilK